MNSNKKNFLLEVGAIISISLFIIYVTISESSAGIEKHQTFINLLTSMQENNTNINENILRTRTFLLDNYDSLVVQTKILSETCEENNRHTYEDLFSKDVKLSNLFQKYCERAAIKIDLVEQF